MSEYVTVAPVSDFREGKIRRYFIQGKEIAVVNWEGTFYAFNNLCPHREFQLHFGFIEDDKIYCPIHYAVFDLFTGKRLEGPQIMDLPVHSVRLEDGNVQVRLSEEPAWHS